MGCQIGVTSRNGATRHLWLPSGPPDLSMDTISCKWHIALMLDVAALRARLKAMTAADMAAVL